MASRKEMGASEGRGQEQQMQGAGAGTATGSGTDTSTRQEQERRVPVSRERGRQGTAVAPRRSRMPSLFATSPSLLAGAFMANPFEFMRRMNDEMDRLFESVGFGSSLLAPWETRAGRPAAWAPQIETLKRGNQFIVRADLPGLDKDDITVEVDNGVLTISGERQEEREEGEEEDGWYRTERSYGAFYRAIPLPEGANEDQISATFNNGVLEVTVPTPEEGRQRGKKVEVK